LTIASSSGSFLMGSAPVAVDPKASLNDGGSLRYGGATFTVENATNADAGDLLSLLGTAPIAVSGNQVTYGGLPLATLTGGAGTNALVFTFTANADQTSLSALLRQVCFSTDATNNRVRVLQMTLAYGAVTVTAQRAFFLDRPPVALDTQILAAAGVATSIPFSNVLANVSDPDGDTLTIADYSASSSYGGQIAATATNFTYTPPTGLTTPDFFVYKVDDGHSGQAIGVVRLRFIQAGQIEIDGGNIPSSGAHITTTGIPDAMYEVQVSTDLIHWSLLFTVMSSPTGIIDIVDATAKNYPQRFYRAVAQ